MGLLLNVPYHGSRTGWYIYHPRLHYGLSFENAKDRFLKQIDVFLEAAKMFSEDVTFSEPVAPQGFRKLVTELIEAIDKETKLDRVKGMYRLEALCELIFEDQDKNGRHYLPTMTEIMRRAETIEHEDHQKGLDLVGLKPIRHTYSG